MCVFEAFLEKSLSKISFLKLFLIHHHTKITYMTLQILLKANSQSFDSCFCKLFVFLLKVPLVGENILNNLRISSRIIRINYFYKCSPNPSSLKLIKNLSFCPHNHPVHNPGFSSYQWWSYCNILLTKDSRWICLSKTKSKFILFLWMALTVSFALIFDKSKNLYAHALCI